MIHVRDCPRGDAAYEAFAAASPAATVYHRPAWLDAVEDGMRLPCRRLLAERDGRAVGFLPLCHVRSALFGNFLISVPFGNFGGIVAEAEEARQPLLDEAVRLAQSLGCRWIELRHVDPLPLALATHTRKVTQTLDLPADWNKLWDSFPAKVRNQVRKAEKSGLTCRFTDRAGLNDFYDVFARNMRDLGTPVYPRRFFEALFDRLGDALRLIEVRQDSTLMGGIVLMTFRRRIECPWASTLREYNTLCPNNLLYWSAMKHACEAGYTLFDFGTSDHDSGTYKFKKQWGAVEQPLHRQFWLAPGQELPHLNPSNPRFAAKIRAWKSLPVWLTKLVGPPLARNLP